MIGNNYRDDIIIPQRLISFFNHLNSLVEDSDADLNADLNMEEVSTVAKLDTLDQSIFQIFDNLTLHELSRLAATSKKMYSLVHDESYFRSKFIPKMSLRELRNNVMVLHKYTNKNMYVYGNYLFPVFPYDLPGRFYNWLYPTSSRKKVLDVVELTLNEIYKINFHKVVVVNHKVKITPTEFYNQDFKNAKIKQIENSHNVPYRVIGSHKYGCEIVYNNDLEYLRSCNNYPQYKRIYEAAKRAHEVYYGQNQQSNIYIQVEKRIVDLKENKSRLSQMFLYK